MSRDDYISKLFINNEHKLDEAPSADIWNRLEARLDQEMPVGELPHSGKELLAESPRGTARIFKLSRYMVAASIALLIVSSLAILHFTKDFLPNETTTSAENYRALDVPLEEVPLAYNSKEEKAAHYAKEDKAQEEKIIAEANKKAKSEGNTSPKIVAMEDIRLPEKSKNVITLSPAVEREQPIALIEPPMNTVSKSSTTNATSVNPPPMVGNSNAGNYDTRQKLRREDYKYDNKDHEEFAGRSFGVPATVDPAIVQSYNDNMPAVEDDLKKESKNKSAIQLRSNEKDKVAKPAMHQQLQIFDWMLGRWIDKEIEGGESAETWRLVDANTIEGTGIKVNSKDKLFEEKMFIVYDPTLRQVFLKMPIDDSRVFISYMLVSFDNERITFQQNDNSNYPNKVMIQRTIGGFSTIIVFDKGFLSTNQQSFLNNRNRVSNVRAIRNLQKAN